jgi:23S rRNA pseudouridine955/2504/2580 synthase/23S rRNA pseudouridine1911/1915/1917 synthase
MDLAGFVLWEDAHLLAVNKPPGLRVLPDGYDPEASHLKEILEPAFGRVWIVHRLDRCTSGVLVAARTAGAHRSLNAQFEARTVSKRYHALAYGSPDWFEKTVDLPLHANGDRRHRTVVDFRKGKPSITHFRVLERFTGYCLLEAVPETGRRHQVRAHLLAAGLPLACDDLYGDGEAVYLSRIKKGYKRRGREDPLLGRPGLHAISLEVDHPLTHERLCFQAKYPGDFACVLNRLHEDK